jgi:hypothetical protein
MGAMWKAAYYKKQAQTFLMLARVSRDPEKAARYTVLAGQFFEKAERVLAEAMMQTAE